MIDVSSLLALYRQTRAVGFAQFLHESHTTVEKLGTDPVDQGQVTELLADQPLFIPTTLEPFRDGRWQWGVTVAQRLLLWMSRDARATSSDRTPIEILAGAERTMSDLATQVLALYAPEKFARSTPAYAARKTAAAFAELMKDAASTMTEAVETWAGIPRESPFGPAAGWDRLLRTEVLTNHAEWHVRSTPQPFEVLLVNPGSPSVDPFALPPAETARGELRLDPNAKLYGTRLGHFAGFGAEKYRSHDWLWGRLDAAACIGTALLKDVHGDTQNDLRQALIDEILHDEGSTKEALSEATHRAASMSGPGLVADLFGQGQIGVGDLTDSVLDLLLPTEGLGIVDDVADEVIDLAGAAVDGVSHVATGVVRVAERVKALAEKFRAKVTGGD